MDFIVRECRIDDAKDIQALNSNELGYEFSLEQTKHKLEKLLTRDSDKIFVAVAEDTVIGYIHANDYDAVYAPELKNIMGIAVSGEYRRHGVGAALLNEAEKWARASGAKGVRLVSGATRSGAHAFYRHMGYEGGKQQLNFKKWF